MGFGPNTGGGAVTPTKVTITYLQFKNAETPGTFPIATSAGAVINVLKVKHSIAFAGSGISQAEIGVLSASRTNYLVNTILDVFSTPSSTNGVEGQTNLNSDTILSQTVPDVLNVMLDLGGGVMDNLSAGSVDVWYVETICT